MTRVSDRRTIEGLWRRYLSKNQPQLQRDLGSVWKSQKESLTFADVQMAVRNGRLPASVAKRWSKSYAKFVRGDLSKSWKDAAAQNSNMVRRGLTQVGFPRIHRTADQDDDYLMNMDDWAHKRAGTSMADLNTYQAITMNRVLHWHTVNEPLSPRRMAQVIKPFVPLTPRQTSYVLGYRQKLIDDGVTGDELDKKMARYADRQANIRAKRIARTELATAYNTGGLITVQGYVANGTLGPGATKEWLTAEDERVCRICGPLDNPPGNVKPLDQEFTSGGLSTQAPPIHPNCRCTLLYDVEEGEFEEVDDSLKLSDDERQTFIDDTYDGGRGFPQDYPTPDDMDDAKLAKSIEDQFRFARPNGSDGAQDGMFPDQARARRQLNQLMTEYGVPSRDLLNADYRSKPLLPPGKNRKHLMPTSSSALKMDFKDDLGRGEAWHSWRGHIRMRKDRLEGAAQFLRGSRSQYDSSSMSFLIHEQMHGQGFITPQQYTTSKFWAGMEEFTTEGSARYIMRDRWLGGPPRTQGGYARMMNSMDEALSRASGWDLETSRGRLHKAALLFKRLPDSTPGAISSWQRIETPGKALNLLLEGVDGYGDLTPAQRKAVKEDLRKVLKRGPS